MCSTCMWMRLRHASFKILLTLEGQKQTNKKKLTRTKQPQHDAISTTSAELPFVQGLLYLISLPSLNRHTLTAPLKACYQTYGTQRKCSLTPMLRTFQKLSRAIHRPQTALSWEKSIWKASLKHMAVRGDAVSLPCLVCINNAKVCSALMLEVPCQCLPSS